MICSAVSYGGAAAAVNMVAPGAHVSAGFAAAVEHAPELDPAQLALQGNDDVTTIASRIDPAEIVKDTPVHLFEIWCAEVPCPCFRKDFAELL